MPRAKNTLPKQSDSAQPELCEAVVELTEEVKALAGQVEVLRVAVDDLRQEVEWALRNFQRPVWTPTQALTSMARDAMAEDFGERINQVKANDLPQQESPQPISDEDRQRELWD